MAFAANIAPSKVWSLNSWYRGARKSLTPALQRPDDSWASSSAEKAEVLLDSWFPPRDPLPDAKSYINDLSSPNDNTRPFISVSNEEVDEAIKGTSNSSAPGLSGISYKAIKWAFSVEPDAITALVRASIRFGIHHDRWKAALIIPIPKPNKKSYSNPRSHRPIQLLDCVGKIVEKVVAKRLLFDVGKYDLMPFCQFGGRPSASCLDAGMSLVHDIQVAHNRKHVSSFLALDIKGFFDHVNHDRMVHISNIAVNLFQLIFFSRLILALFVTEGLKLFPTYIVTSVVKGRNVKMLFQTCNLHRRRRRRSKIQITCKRACG